jgi:hypothetical protein
MSAASSQKAITITISLLKHKNPQTIELLKNFLTFIPNPNHIKDVLTTAVIELIYVCPLSALWLFQNPTVLEPEIQVRKIISEEITHKMLAWGYTLDDFHFTANQRLEVSKRLQENLFSCKRTPADEAILSLIRALLQQ